MGEGRVCSGRVYLKRLDNYDLRLRFRLRCGAAGLLEEKKRIKLCGDDRCVLCWLKI